MNFKIISSRIYYPNYCFDCSAPFFGWTCPRCGGQRVDRKQKDQMLQRLQIWFDKMAEEREMKMNITTRMIAVVILIGMIIAVLLLQGCSVLRPLVSGPVVQLPETAKDQLFQTIASTNWLLTLTIIGVGAGFFAFLNGSSKGLQFMAACFVTLSLVLGLTRYSAWIAAVAMIGAVALVLYSVLVKNKALKEVISGVQGIRRLDLVTDGSLAHKVLTEIGDRLDVVQSKSTKAIVKTIRSIL